MEITHFSGTTITGISTRTDNVTEFDATKGKIGPLWQRFDATIPVDYQHGERVYGIYFDYQSDHTGEFTVLAGFDGKQVPDDIAVETVTIPEGKYLMFRHQGQMPQIAIDAWTEVWQYFQGEECKHQRCFSTDFEYYPNGNEIQVHIAIE